METLESLEILASKSTPKIDFNSKTNVLSMNGESYPENTVKFYAPIFNWLEQYIKQLGDNKVTINIELVYFNSSSSKVLMDIFDILEDASAEGKDITLNWLYDVDNDASLEYGEEFSEDVESLNFNLIEKS